MTNTTWINDPKLQNIPQEKLHFLQAILSASSTLSQKDMIPFLFAFQKKMKESHIRFSSMELETILSVIQQYATKEELQMITLMQTAFHE